MAYSKELSETSKAKVDEFIRESGTMYSVNEAAAILGKAPYTIAVYVKKGQLHGQKVGGRWRFTKEQINEFLKGGKSNEQDQ